MFWIVLAAILAMCCVGMWWAGRHGGIGNDNPEGERARGEAKAQALLHRSRGNDSGPFGF